jgi:peptidoglycan hydrolase CwlO-like protein
MHNSETFSDIIERIKDIKHLRSDAQVAKALNMSRNDLYGFKRRKTIPHDALHEFCKNEVININYIMNGTLPIYEQDVHKPGAAPISEPQQPYSSNHKTSDLLIKTASVLESTTVFSGALKSNIEAFHTAIKFEAELDDANRKISDLENKMKQIEARLLPLEKSA